MKHLKYVILNSLFCLLFVACFSDNSINNTSLVAIKEVINGEFVSTGEEVTLTKEIFTENSGCNV